MSARPSRSFWPVTTRPSTWPSRPPSPQSLPTPSRRRSTSARRPTSSSPSRTAAPPADLRPSSATRASSSRPPTRPRPSSARRRGRPRRSRPRSRALGQGYPVDHQPLDDHHRPGRRLARFERRHDHSGRLRRHDRPSMAIDFAPSTPMDHVGGYVYFDTDQFPSTGLPAEGLSASPARTSGWSTSLTSSRPADGFVPIWNADTFDLVAEAPASVIDHTIAFDIPLEALGGDDGLIIPRRSVRARTVRLGAHSGHGTIQPFTDVPWLSESPDSGTLDINGSQPVTLPSAPRTSPPASITASRLRHERAEADGAVGRGHAHRDAAARVRRDLRDRDQRPYLDRSAASRRRQHEIPRQPARPDRDDCR